MSHLRKKIEHELHDYNIHIYCEFFPIINNRCLQFYDYDKGRKRFLFYYLYEPKQNLKQNIKNILEKVHLYTNYLKLENCKKGYPYMKSEDYLECQQNCFWRVYCKKVGEENV